MSLFQSPEEESTNAVKQCNPSTMTIIRIMHTKCDPVASSCESMTSKATETALTASGGLEVPAGVMILDSSRYLLIWCRHVGDDAWHGLIIAMILHEL
jgi:hypothetical protein